MFITFDQLTAEAPNEAVAEVIAAASRTAPTGDALVMDVVVRRDRWLDEMTVDELRGEWRRYHRLTVWPYPAAAATAGL
jgi:hypothetical protein